MPSTSKSWPAAIKPAAENASSAVLTSGMICTFRLRSPGTACGSCWSLFLLCGANRSVAICSAVEMAASKDSRLWSWKRGRRFSASASSHSYSMKSMSRRDRSLDGMESHHLEQAGGALPAADAHRHDDVFDAAALAFDQRVAGQARARHAIRVADGDRAAVDVQAVHRNAQLVGAVQHLHGERFVQFPQADVLDLQAGLFQQFRNCEHGTDAHLVRLATGHGEATEDAQRLQAFRFGDFGVHHDGHRSAVRKLASVAGAEDAARHRAADLGDRLV